MIRKNISVEEVVFGKGLAEVLKVRIKGMSGGKRDLAVVYVPPKTDAWSLEEYEVMLKDSKECLEEMIKNSDNISIMGDFNCKEVCWEDWTTGGSENSWGSTLLKLTMENVMTQWINESTRVMMVYTEWKKYG